MEFAHTSVLLEETIEGLAIKPDGIYVDGTLGGGATEALKDLVGKKLVSDFDPVDGFLSMGNF